MHHPRLVVLVLALAAGIAGCSAQRPVATWAPTECLAREAPVSSYRLEQTDVPGFKAPVMEAAVVEALDRIGWRRVSAPAPADVTVHLDVSLIRLGGPAPTDGADPLAEPGMTSPEARFVGHADLEVTEGVAADGTLLWKGAMERMHRVSGAEAFHSDRATALIGGALTELFVPLQRTCAETGPGAP